MTHRRPRAWLRATLGAIVPAALALASPSCKDDGEELFTITHDAGSEGGDEAGDAGPAVDPTLGGPCTEDGQCDDQIPCTFDRCDKTLSRCRNTPDDTVCDDGIYCNGKERCVLRQGCAAGPVVTCQDDNLCTIDRCVEETRSCERAERDVDGDGDPDDHCVGDRDCDDTDPAVSSQKTEICNNFKDDDCDGDVDEQPCAEAANDVCATARAISAAGTYLLTTVAAKKDYATSCSVKSPAAANDIVVAITVPGAVGGPAKDVLVSATTSGTTQSNEVAVALQATCGQAASEIHCGHVESVPQARAIARSRAAASVVYAVVTTQAESAVDLTVTFPDASGAPTNETCAAPTPVAIDTPFDVSIVDAAKDLATDCTRAKTGELTYSFNLATPRDVRIFASTLSGPGEPVISIRDTVCTNELRCRVGAAPPSFARNLPAGTHTFAIAGTSQLDASVLVKTYPPTAAPPNQSCSTAPAIVPNTSMNVDLSMQEDAIKNGCLPGGPAAAYRLDLTETSDVLVVGRFPTNEIGAVSINGPGCAVSDVLVCTPGQTPTRASRRALGPGSYRIVVADELGQNVGLMALVRPTAPPTVVTTANGCADPLPLPLGGGFFSGDTTAMTADFEASCDAPGQPLGTANDQLFKLELPSAQRVVLDMTGSFLRPVLNLRQGAVCPGLEVPGACNAGTGPTRSFLDRTLPAGTYWVQVDGFAGDKGAWNLDVRVLPP